MEGKLKMNLKKGLIELFVGVVVFALMYFTLLPVFSLKSIEAIVTISIPLLIVAFFVIEEEYYKMYAVFHFY